MLKHAKGFVDSGKALRTKLFMAAGSSESERMTSDMLEIARLLETVEGLEIETRIFPDESHATALPLNYSHGVRWAYPRPETDFLSAYKAALEDRAETRSD